MCSQSGNKFFNRYTSTEWFLLKLTVAIIWLRIMSKLFIDTSGIPYPAAICSLFDCSFLATPVTARYIYYVSLLLGVLYLSEKCMKYTTFLMFLISCLGFTLEESNGVMNRCALYSMVFFAQSAAYFMGGQDIKKKRIQFAVQVIAAGYFLAGVSKLLASGPGWVTDAPNAAVQMIKNYAYEYYDSGSQTAMDMGYQQAQFVLDNKPVIIVLFAFSLLFELTAWVAMFSKRHAFVYGFLLLGMHMGILYFMDILIVAIFYPMLIVLLNPAYTIWFWLGEAGLWIKRKLDF